MSRKLEHFIFDCPKLIATRTSYFQSIKDVWLESNPGQPPLEKLSFLFGNLDSVSVPKGAFHNLKHQVVNITSRYLNNIFTTLNPS